MEALFDALQEGRLFELPSPDKTQALTFLAHVIEAFPSLPAGTDVAGGILARESEAGTALGGGWACPHARVRFEGDLVCVAGWSPAGIDYGAPDGAVVHIVIMYLVPANQQNAYLKSISALAKTLERRASTLSAPTPPGADASLEDVRNYLLDIMIASREMGLPDARARMIRLQAKPVVPDLALLDMEPVTIITGPDMRPVVLCQNPELAKALEADDAPARAMETESAAPAGEWRLIRRGLSRYLGGRAAYECVAVRFARAAVPAPGLKNPEPEGPSATP